MMRAKRHIVILAALFAAVWILKSAVICLLTASADNPVQTILFRYGPFVNEAG